MGRFDSCIFIPLMLPWTLLSPRFCFPFSSSSQVSTRGVAYLHNVRSFQRNRILRRRNEWLVRLYASSPTKVDLLNTFLPLAIHRAKRTLITTTTTTTTSTTSNVTNDDVSNASVDDNNNHQNEVRGEVISTVNQLFDQIPTNTELTSSSQQQQQQKQSSQCPEVLSYSENPAISLTALAHSLWSRVITPDLKDDMLVVDATCGNGHDSLALARLLFADQKPCESMSTATTTSTTTTTEESSSDPHPSTCKPRLLCLDIQPQACINTRSKLSQEIDEHTLATRVQILNVSHERLEQVLLSSSSLSMSSSLGLVVYNLGYLPGTWDKTSHVTRLETTLASLTDAIRLLRVGGMMSVMTYSSNPLEQEAVHVLLEAMALLSVRNRCQLLQELFQAPPMSSSSPEYAHMISLVQTALEKVQEYHHDKSCWRVIQHKSMGRPQSPMLVTATRIR